MGKTLRILTNNYNGYRANIVYHPTTGGTRNLGLHVLPYDYISDFIYGEYLINIIKFDKTCVLNYPPPACDFTGSVTIIPPQFISVWRTTTPSESITLPYDIGGTYSGIINWGDGNTSVNSYDNKTHIYDYPGDYTITIIGTISGFNFLNYGGDKNKIIEILQWGSNFNLGNDGYYFFSCNNLTLTGVTDTLNLVGTTDLSGIFAKCYNIITINNINDWDVSDVINMSYTFGKSSFNQDISSWNVSGVTSMVGMFETSQFNQDINSWDVSNVQNMEFMFDNATNFNQDLSGWCVINIPSLPTNFDTDATAWVLPRPIWGTCPPAFISIWRTTTPLESITLPYSSTGIYSGTIDWGDGNISGNSYDNQTHTYDDDGDYTITIIGTIIGFNFGVDYLGDSYDKIIEILQWGSLNLGNNGNYFSYCQNLILTGVTDTLNLVGTTDLSSIFYNCLSLTTINNINDWNVSDVIYMGGMFTYTQFDQPINDWVVSGVTNMSGMFVASPFNQPLSGWNVSNVTNMNEMFYTSQFNQPINNWIVSGVTNMSGMFSYTPFDQPLSGWNVSNVTGMTFMFAGTPFNQPIGNWEVSGVILMDGMFADSIFDQDINLWDVSNVRNMYYMFGGSQFNQPLSGWNVSSVIVMEGMFNNSQFTQPLSNWERISPDISTLSNVRNMTWMFSSALFNQPIGNWNVSGVTDMEYMFLQNYQFNQPLSGWNVSKVTNMSNMFDNTTYFNQPIGNWIVSGVTNMYAMFSQCRFDQSLSGWNVSNVTNMSSMFFRSYFNQPISNWNVSKVTNMESMFRGSRFNQDIGNWNISGVTNFSFFMSEKSPLSFSSANLNSIYNGWSTKNPKPNLNITFGSAKYTSAGQPGKDILSGSTMSGGYGWTITDGGLI